MKHTDMDLEQVSALADGRLQGDELIQVIDHMGVDEASREVWQTYHLIGDVLRSGVHAPCSDPSAFLARFQARLAAEPPLQPPATTVPEVAHPRAEAANAPMFRWKLVAGLASLAAVAVIGWNVLDKVMAPPVPAPWSGDPRLNQLLEAHHQIDGVSQLPSEFLRNVAFEQPLG